MREGNLEAPTRHPIDWKNPEFYDEGKALAEMERVFAICHGYAHGAEMPGAANAFSFAIGFVVATGLLHMCGIALGFLTLVPKGQYLVRTLGGAISVVGFGFLFGYL